MIKSIRGINVKLSALDKLLFPKSGITKGDIIEYYAKIDTYMLPYMKDRPITMRRFPRGILENGFYQKQIPEYFPGWIDRVEVQKVGGSLQEVICNHPASIVYLANQYVLSFHIWASKQDKIQYPDRLIFDLDPSTDDFSLVIKTAKILREFHKESLNLTSYVMTTGSKGLHVVVPIIRKYTFDEVRAFARLIAEHLSDLYSTEMTTEIRKNKRKGRLFIDYLRNAYAQTAVAPYSIRAKENAPIATPLSWDELNNRKLSSQSFHIKNIFKRLSHKTDPWMDYLQNAQDLTSAMEKLKTTKMS